MRSNDQIQPFPRSRRRREMRSPLDERVQGVSGGKARIRRKGRHHYRLHQFRLEGGDIDAERGMFVEQAI